MFPYQIGQMSKANIGIEYWYILECNQVFFALRAFNFKTVSAFLMFELLNQCWSLNHMHNFFPNTTSWRPLEAMDSSPSSSTQPSGNEKRVKQILAKKMLARRKGALKKKSEGPSSDIGELQLAL